MSRAIFIALGVALGCAPRGPSASDLDRDGFDATADCDDEAASVHPGAEERCNGIDDDCDGVVDDNPVESPMWYVDADGDGWGDDQQQVAACVQPSSTASQAGDCDDTRPEVHPGADEVCLDGVDNDCQPGDDGSCALEGEVTTSQAPFAWGYQVYVDCEFVDYSGDGKTDAICFTQDGTATLFDGPLEEEYPRGPTLSDPRASGAWPAAIGDFTGDGVVDIAYATGALAIGPLGKDAEVAIRVTMPEPASGVAAGDFDDDGQLDLAFVHADEAARVLLGPFDHVVDLSEAVLTVGGEGVYYLRSAYAADLVGASGDDLVLPTGDGIAVFNGWTRGTVAFAEADIRGEQHFGALPHPDLDGDHRTDLIVNDKSRGTGPQYKLVSSPVPTDLAAAEPLAFVEQTESSTIVAAGDLDGDGRTDLVLYSQNNVYYVLRGPFSGTLSVADAFFTVRHDVPGLLDSGGWAGIADLDDDGRPDLYVAERSPEASTFGYVFWGSGL